MNLAQSKRIVIKVGSALLVDEASGQVRAGWLSSLAADIAELRRQGKQVIVVSSGAIALGRRALGAKSGALRLEEKQAAAACGQIALMKAWREAMAGHDVTVAQILLTLGDTEDRRRYLNARNTLDTLSEHGALPIINENDTVATSEIRFGDNDRLAARVAQMVSADTLLLLSDIDGLYTADPRKDAEAAFIPEVRGITSEIVAMAGGAGSPHGSGGMATKIEAAKIALTSGCHMAILKGSVERPIGALMNGGRATWFVASESPYSARKHWISGSIRPAGVLVVDAGAAKALREGKSLLPAGVKSLSGAFERGDAVDIRDEAGAVIGKGLVAYSAADAARIIGHQSGEIEQILGFKGRSALVHRDDLVVG